MCRKKQKVNIKNIRGRYEYNYYNGIFAGIRNCGLEEKSDSTVDAYGNGDNRNCVKNCIIYSYWTGD